jgi:hypothetical protein
VPWLPCDPAEAAHVLEDEEIVVGTSSLPVGAWRDAYAFGYLVSALWNQCLLQTTIHLVRFALGRDLPRFVDALLAGAGPRLRAIRAGLDRLSAAVIAGEASALPVAGAGPRRREPTDAVCAAVLADPAAFYAEVADIAAAFAAEAGEAAMLRDAMAWDALQALPPGGDAEARRFAFDWPAYTAQMGECPQPRRGPIELRVQAWPGAMPGAGERLDFFLRLGWSKQARFMIEAT